MHKAGFVNIVGNPNVGKSTLFNALTGARASVGNWPGTTVDVGRGVWTSRSTGATADWTLVDLPGAYSLDASSPDEQLTADLLVEGPADERPDVAVVVADASHLARSLYLVSQLRERGGQLVVALTMADLAAQHGLTIDPVRLSHELGCPAVLVDPRHRQGLADLAATVAATLVGPRQSPRDGFSAACCGECSSGQSHCGDLGLVADAAQPSPGIDLALEDDRFAFIDRAVSAASHDCGETRRRLSDRVDAWVTRPVVGPLIFLAVMWLVFQLTTTVAAPMQDGLDALVSGPISHGASWLLDHLGLGGTWLEGLVVNGLIAGVGMLLTFVPLMAMMFILLALLEDSGYMARAAVVTDRLMRRLGLPGKAFLPLVVGFGCNVPAISATRILPQAQQRVLTSLLIPFTSCSARLTVYALVATTFFGPWAGTVVFAMYLLSIGFVVLVGLLLRKTLWRTMGQDALLLDLPNYQRPTLRLTWALTWTRLKGFLRTAGGIIVATVCAVWLLQSIPISGDQGFGHVDVEDSAYATAAQAIAPVFEPAGFGQWQTASALVVGFVAKEAVISSWAQTYAVAEPSGNQAGDLGAKIKQSFDHSSGGHPLPAVMAFLVFLLAYTPCVATLAAQKREIGLRWTLFGIAVQLSIAWLAAVAVFQVGKLIW